MRAVYIPRVTSRVIATRSPGSAVFVSLLRNMSSRNRRVLRQQFVRGEPATALRISPRR
jgi:hypothetical protein